MATPPTTPQAGAETWLSVPSLPLGQVALAGLGTALLSPCISTPKTQLPFP